MSNFTDYEMRGSYFYCGHDGTFLGVLRRFTDGRLAAIMNDDGTDITNHEKTKLALGIAENDSIAFLKFAPDSRNPPLIYATKQTNPLSYEGRWAPLEIPKSEFIKGTEDLQGLPELAAAFEETRTEKTLEILGAIEKSRTQSYLNPRLIQDVSRLSPYIGAFALTELVSLSA